VVAWLRLKQASCHYGRREVDIQENRMLQYPHISSLEDESPKGTFIFAGHERRTTLHAEEATMEMFGRVGLVEIPILIAPDQKVWMDKMIKEGKIAIPPGGTLEKGSLYSMFIRMLLHNAMEEQKRQEALEADDEDDE
jgi:hypothetical protein